MSVWQPIEGAANAEIAALINKPSITNSNAYLLRTPNRLVIIDPGAEPAQVERLNTLVAQTLEEAARPVILLLTHTHLDHFGAVEGLKIAADRPRTIVHAIGAKAIREKDHRHVLAFLYRDGRVPNLVIDDTFFGPMPGKGIVRREEQGPDSVAVSVERLSLAPDLDLDVYETPGHSPCSCTFRVGRHLIVGDVPFGANPGLAGLIGWSGEGLIRSSRLIRHLIGRHDITTCWTGHGNAMPASVATKTLAGVESQVSSLGRIAVIDQDRITLLRQFAVELLHEIERLFTLIGARLMIVAHRLEEMEETEEAARLAAVLDFDAIEMQLAEFREFCQAFERGEQPELSIAMKAAATLGRVRRVVAEQSGGANTALSLAGRAEHLIDSFLQTLRGLSFQPDLERVDLPALVSALVKQEQSPRFGADDFLAASDDEEAFRRLLVGNLATSSILRGHKIGVRRAEWSDDDWDGTTTTDVLRFQNILIATLEAMVAGGVGEIDILLGRREGRSTLRMSRASNISAIPSLRAALYNRAMEQIGGDYRIDGGNVLIRL